MHRYDYNVVALLPHWQMLRAMQSGSHLVNRADQYFEY